jgi:hypothetical protein
VAASCKWLPIWTQPWAAGLATGSISLIPGPARRFIAFEGWSTNAKDASVEAGDIVNYPNGLITTGVVETRRGWVYEWVLKDNVGLDSTAMAGQGPLDLRADCFGAQLSWSPRAISCPIGIHVYGRLVKPIRWRLSERRTLEGMKRGGVVQALL